ncbi:MAG: hypothetical protein MUO31_02660 [Thermodesulfovibrionales bacterium]|nr:hypothetical protein [Thermodesulfovibrionales bacterium]
MEQANEYEISVRIKVTQSIFDNLRVKCPNARQTFVHYFAGGFRRSEGRLQAKKTTLKRTYLAIIDQLFLPFVYTESIELNQLNSHPVGVAETAIVRFVCHEQAHIRVSIDAVHSNTGVGYFLTAEREFDKKPHTSVFDDDGFFKVVFTYLQSINDIDNIIASSFDTLQISRQHSFPSRKFGEIKNLQSVSVDHMIPKAKFNGYKGKFFVSDDIGFFLNATHDAGLIRGLPSDLLKRSGVVFQYEVMVHNIILTDVVGVYINNVLYETHPRQVLEFLESLDYNNIPLTFNDQNYCMFTQRRLPTWHSPPTPPDLVDGIIIVCGDVEYKYKSPTCDIRITKGRIYIDSYPMPVDMSTYPKLQDGIYEIKLPTEAVFIAKYDKFSMKYDIIRKRYDRVHTSTAAEFASFVNNCKLSNKHQNEAF